MQMQMAMGAMHLQHITVITEYVTAVFAVIWLISVTKNNHFTGAL